jgi:predicted phage replisome organizer
MFDNRKVRHLRRLPEGNNIVLIWVMLLTMAGRCNAGGMIFLTENIPYNTKMLADELDFEENTVRLALEALERFGMVSTNGDWLSIAGWQEHQNIEGMERIREQNRARKALQREREKTLAPSVSRDRHVTVTQCHATDKDKEERIKSEEKEIKSVRETTRTLFDRLVADYAISSDVKDKMAEWIAYKTERKEPYKEQGMKALLRQVENAATKYGCQAVCDLIDESMASGWKGIIFDRLKNEQAEHAGGRKHGKAAGNPFIDYLREGMT